MENRESDRINIRKVLKGKNARMGKLVPGFLINYLRRIVHEDEINRFLGEYGHLKDTELVSAFISYLGITYQVHNRELLPAEGKFIFVSNHPLGGLDGLVFIEELSKHYRNLRFPANDLLLNIEEMSGIFIPVNKHGAQTRDAARMLDMAYASDDQILYFPAGLCSRKRQGRIVDLEWQKSFIAKAVKHRRDIIPAYFSGKNSNFFYNLANLRKWTGIKFNIEMIYLADEMFSQRGKEIHLVFGEPVPWETFDNSKRPVEWAAWMKEKTYALESYIPRENYS